MRLKFCQDIGCWWIWESHCKSPTIGIKNILLRWTERYSKQYAVHDFCCGPTGANQLAKFKPSLDQWSLDRTQNDKSPLLWFPHHNNLLSSRLTVVYERVPVVFQQQPGDNWRLLRCETPMIVSLGEYDKQKYTTASFTVLPTSTTQHSCAHSQLWGQDVTIKTCQGI